MHVHSVKLLHQNQWVSVQDQFQTPRSVESFHEVTEPEQPRLFPCLLICPGYTGKLRQTSSRWEVTAHKLQHANPFHRCSHLGAKWFKVIEVPCHPWQDLFTFPVGGCGLMLLNGQRRYTSLREISPVKRTKQNLVKKKKKLSDFASRSVYQLYSQWSKSHKQHARSSLFSDKFSSGYSESLCPCFTLSS